MTDLTTARGSDLREPDPLPGLAAPDADLPAGPAVAVREGVPLTRLLALARLSAPQALELAAGLLAEAAGPGARARPDRALVGTDGRVVLDPAPDGGGSGSPPAGGVTGDALGTVLAQVAGAARLRGRPADPAAEELLTELDRAATDLPGAGASAVAARLRETAARIDRDVVRGELAALVRAVCDRAAPAPGRAAAGSPSPGRRPAARVPLGESRTTMRRIGVWLFSVVVLAAGVVVEVALVRDDIAADIELLLDAGRSGSAASTASERDGLPIAPPAPAAAGSVAAVDLRPLAPCAPAAPCTLRLLVRLVPGPDPQTVTWSYRLVDRCTGAATTVPGGTVTVPAGGQRAAAVGTVALPDQPSVAVIAVTSSPATAASAPVTAGSCLPDRPDGTG
ncbi:hypothetical protein [Modestobacter altitudinis]|uniref:hypothetical protein n=1 Tax=Modestobacter altitudinis TaxID=2213158 RepID=UPI00110D0145|nr:hypothetical protein [Modestobacter altitudinis]